eukprot:SAG22_NODE_10298_length_542_cov_1.546275_1_plen_74_part_10
MPAVSGAAIGRACQRLPALRYLDVEGCASLDQPALLAVVRRVQASNRGQTDSGQTDSLTYPSPLTRSLTGLRLA